MSATIRLLHFAKAALAACMNASLALGAVTGEARVLDHPDEDQAVLGVDGHVRRVRAAVAELSFTHAPAEAVARR